MPEKEAPWDYASVNKWLLQKLTAIAEQHKKNGLPFPKVSDILNTLMIYYIIEETNDPEVVQLAKKLEKLDRNIHTAVQSFITSLQKRG